MVKGNFLKILPVLGLVSGLAACKVPNDYVYATVDGQPLKLRLHKPADGTPVMSNGKYPAILFLHGGNWAPSAFGEFPPQYARFVYSDGNLKAVANKGYVVASATYRLTNARVGGVSHPNAWPAQIQDVKCAVRWLRTHADEYNIDINAIGVSGISAGGHLAAMLGETSVDDGFEPDVCPNNVEDSSVQAVSTWSAPSDIVAWWGSEGGTGADANLVETFPRKGVANLIGDVDETQAGVQLIPYFSAAELENRYPDYVEKMQAASPINYVDSNGPPTLVIQTSEDTIVPSAVSQRFHQRLVSMGRTTSYFLTPGDHDYNFGAMPKAYNTTVAWFDYYLKGIAPGCTTWPGCAAE